MATWCPSGRLRLAGAVATRTRNQCCELNGPTIVFTAAPASRPMVTSQLGCGETANSQLLLILVLSASGMKIPLTKRKKNGVFELLKVQ